MNLYQSTSQLKNLYKTYTYVIFGPERVGKTNIITRFVKDQFTEAHNMTLEGQQSVIVSIDSRHFQIVVHDTAGQENLISMKAVWRSNKDGFIFVFAIDNKQSFEDLLSDIIQIKSSEQYRNVPAIVIGNKLDLRNTRQVERKQAQNQLRKFNLKYFQISAKVSAREDIEKIFIELIQMNEMNLYQTVQEKSQSGSRMRRLFCCEEASQQSESNSCRLI